MVWVAVQGYAADMNGELLEDIPLTAGHRHLGQAAAQIAHGSTDPREWPRDLQNAYRASLVEKQYREMRFLLLVGLGVNAASTPIDFITMPAHALDMLLLRLGVVLPLQIAGLLMPVRFVGWQKLLAGLSIIALSAILLVGTQWAAPMTAPILAIGPIMLLGMASTTLPFSPRDHLAFVAGFSSMLLAVFLLMDTDVLRDPAFIGITCITIGVSVLLPRRLWSLEGRNFLLSMQSQNRLHSLIETNAQLTELSRKDPLTGLANRRHAEEVFASHNYGQPVTGEARVAVLMVDIDRFKAFNDDWGHQAGDACLIAAAEEMRHLAARHGGLAARFGGEEFVIILRVEAPQQALEVAEELRRAIERIEIAVPERDALATCTASIGVAVHGGQGIPALPPLLSAADGALYAAKDKGRNRAELSA